MKYNWDKFFLRLTIVLSVIVFISMTYIAHEHWIDRWWGSWHVHVENWMNSSLYGFLGAICVWGIYFIVRWVCSGLRK